MTLSKEPYKGTRDFYPEEMYLQKYIFETMGKVAESYGYTEYGASILEETDLYRAKTGEEIVNEQTYSFTDRGGRDVTIRPEMTPTVARMVARKRKELVFPLRWYSIPNLFRYERPQRGRLREHWQLNVDVFGIASIEADAEIIAVSYEIMKAFGAKDEHFTIKINNRKLINFLLNDVLKLESKDAYPLSKIIDRKDKLPKLEFEAQARAILDDRTDQFISLLNTKDLKEFASLIPANEGVQELIALSELLQAKRIVNVVFDPSLMRGFDYYTGTVFEVFDTNPINNRSLFGGGRYDDLVGLFGEEKVGGVGFGMGDVTIKDFMEVYGLMPGYKATALVYLCPINAQYFKKADELADRLRASGVNVAVDYTERKLAAQIKTADKQGLPFIICVGDEEVDTGIYKVKNLQTREQVEVAEAELLSAVKNG
jgi:histidyl-tRNA synthetase